MKKARFQLIEPLKRHAAASADRIALWWTKGVGHAEALAAKASRQGYERIVAAGGDGTLHEVVNGTYRSQGEEAPVIGMIPLGTGCDYPRNFDLGQNLDDNISTALWGRPISVDAGLIALRGFEGAIIRRVFVSVLGIGFDASVVRLYRRQTSWKGTRFAYASSILKEWLKMRPYVIRGEIDSRPFRAETILFAAGLGQYYGHGIRITPRASVCSGRFQFVWGEDLNRFGILILLVEALSGRHVNSRNVRWRLGQSANLHAIPQALIEADGELIGMTPAALKILPGAFRFAAGEKRPLPPRSNGE
jgi:YegS/Rv2252/BmrU family lipid kinase